MIPGGSPPLIIITLIALCSRGLFLYKPYLSGGFTIIFGSVGKVGISNS